MRRVEVFWRDSMAQAGWVRPDDLSKDREAPDYLNCSSIGYLFAEDENAVTIVQSQNPGGQVGEPLTIPREAVTAIKNLRAA